MAWIESGTSTTINSSSGSNSGSSGLSSASVIVPNEILILKIEYYDDKIHLKWAQSPDDESNILRYNIYWSKTDVKPTTLSDFENNDSVTSDKKEYVISDFEKNKTYYFLVTPVDNNGIENASIKGIRKSIISDKRLFCINNQRITELDEDLNALKSYAACKNNSPYDLRVVDGVIYYNPTASTFGSKTSTGTCLCKSYDFGKTWETMEGIDGGLSLSSPTHKYASMFKIDGKLYYSNCLSSNVANSWLLNVENNKYYKHDGVIDSILPSSYSFNETIYIEETNALYVYESREKKIYKINYTINDDNLTFSLSFEVVNENVIDSDVIKYTPTYLILLYNYETNCLDGILTSYDRPSNSYYSYYYLISNILDKENISYSQIGYYNGEDYSIFSKPLYIGKNRYMFFTSGTSSSGSNTLYYKKCKVCDLNEKKIYDFKLSGINSSSSYLCMYSCVEYNGYLYIKQDNSVKKILWDNAKEGENKETVVSTIAFTDVLCNSNTVLFTI